MPKGGKGIDGEALMKFVRRQAIMSGKKILEYLREDLVMSYDTLFSIKKSGMIGNNTKSKLDSYYRDNKEYVDNFTNIL